jgi:hypothetical protein
MIKKIIIRNEKLEYKYPNDGPIPNKGDELSYNGINGIVDFISYLVVEKAYEIIINIKTKYK